MWLRVVAAVAVLVAAGLAAVPGPIDRRYPDYIVDPKVKCFEEGVFPHPRNCSWYYRCKCYIEPISDPKLQTQVDEKEISPILSSLPTLSKFEQLRCNDRIGNGFYWTTYYECEPGTVFSDDLDQCIFPHDPKYRCKTDPGDVTSKPPTPRPPKNETVCKTIESSCQNYDTCSDGFTVQRQWLCRSQQCTINGISQRISNICPTQQLFSRSQNTCVREPSGDCGITPTTPEPVTPTKPGPTECKTIDSSCQNYDTCSSDGFTVQKQWLCRSQQCTIDGIPQRVSDICPTLESFPVIKQLFSRSQNACVREPSGGNPCPETCDILESSCNNYEVCQPTKRNIRLCSLQRCRQGTQSSDRSPCKGQQLYDFQAKTCVDKPTGVALCENQRPICNIVDSSCEDFDVCIPSKKEQRLCERERCTIGGVDQGEQKKCSGALLYDMTNRNCVARPSNDQLCGATTICTTNVTSCNSYDLCSPYKQYVTLCSRESCKRGLDIWEQDHCKNSGMLYSLNIRKCVLQPKASQICIPGPGPEPKPDYFPIFTTCTASECEDFEVCQPSRKSQRMCAKEKCTRGGKYIGERNMCETQGHMYDLQTRKCAQRPSAFNICKPPVPELPGPSPRPPRDIPIICITLQYTCQTYKVCDPNQHTQTLCERESCSTEGQYLGERNICFTPGLYYDLTLRRCVARGNLCPSPQPTPPEVCEVLDSSCENYDICQPAKRTVRLCSLKRCRQGTQTADSNICNGQQFYDTQTWNCVNKPSENQVCNTKPPRTICTTVLTTCKSYDLCSPFKQYVTLCSRESCKRDGQDIGEQPHCTDSGMLYNLNTRTCVLQPKTSQICIPVPGPEPKPDYFPIITTCTASECENFEVCYPSRNRQKMCAKESCTRNGKYIGDRDMCSSQGLMYDLQTRRCTQRPSTFNICKPPVPELPEPSPPTPPLPRTICNILQYTCQTYKVCDPNQRSQTLCERESCSREGQYLGERNICLIPGQYYDLDLRKCVARGNLCPSPQPTPPEVCEVLDSSCENYDICQPAKRTVRLCSLKRCRQGTQTADRNICNGQQFYDTQTWNCVNKPSENQLCNTKPPTTICTTLLTTCKSYDLCSPFKQYVTLCSRESCNRDGQDIGERPHCKDSGMLYNLNTRTCVLQPKTSQICIPGPDPGPKPSYTTCTPSECENFEVCYPSRNRQRMCTKESCTRNGKYIGDRDMCSGQGLMYDLQTRRCAQRPSAFNICKPPVPKLPEPSPPTPPLPTTICTTLQYTCQTYEVCDPNQRTQSLCERESCSREGQYLGERNICLTPGQYYDLTSKRCVARGLLCSIQPPTQPEVCSILDSSCENYDICQPAKRTVRLCSLKRCRQGTQTSDKIICSGQQFYDTQTWNCVNKPSEQELCLPEVCRIDQSSCRTYNVCLSNISPPFDLTLCELERCSRGTQDLKERIKCPGGQLYNQATKKCANKPRDVDICENKKDPPVNINTICTTIEASCKDYNVCFPSRRTQRLCERESCKRDGVITGEQKMCGNSGQLYDVSQRTCVTVPSANQLCSPEPSPDNDTCTTVVTSCKNYEICKPRRQLATLCSLERCYRNGQDTGERTKCTGNRLYSLQTRACVLRPTSSQVCPNPPGPNPPKPDYPITTCTISESSCEDFEICQPSRSKKRMCAKESCTREGQVLGERDMCFTKGQMYDLQTRSCAQRPSTFSICKPPFTPIIINVDQNTPTTICTTLLSSCKGHNVCDPNQRTQTLCERESCSREGKYLGERNICFIPGLYFDLTSRRCLQQPTTKDLCSEPSCNIVESSCLDYNVCFPSTRTQRLCERESCETNDLLIEEQKICLSGQLYDISQKTCVTPPTAKDLCSEASCNIVESSCQDYDVCFPSKRTQRLCDRESCKRNNLLIEEKKICPVLGQLYDISQKRCVIPPTDDALCSDTTTDRPTSKCTPVESTCQNYEVCSPTRRTQRLCQKEQCTRDGQNAGERNMCFTPGTLWDLEISECVRPPTGNALCSNLNTERPNTERPNTERPNTERPTPSECKPVELTCQSYEVCSPTRRTQRLCQKEQCTRDGQNAGERNMCFTPGTLWDLETSECVRTPTANQLCQAKPDDEHCTPVVSSCENFEICKPSSSRQLATLCALERCYRDGQFSGEKTKCTGNKLYNLQTRACELRPPSSQICTIPTGPNPPNYPITTCTTLDSSCEDFELCQPSRSKKRMCAKESCTREGKVLGERDMCFIQGQMYDLQTRRCAQRPPSFNFCRPPFTPMPINFPVNTPTTICTVMLSSCKAHNVCAPNQRTQTMCERESCSREGQYLGERNICIIPGLYYDLTLRRCVQQPSSNDLCTTLPSDSICTTVESTCQSYEVCSPTRRTQKLCEKEQCKRDGQYTGELKNMCFNQPGKLYDLQTRQCVRPPTGNQLCNPSTGNTPTTCSPVVTSCENYEICKPSRQLATLCAREQCYRDGQVTGEKTKCTGGKLYSLQTRACVFRPTTSQMCSSQPGSDQLNYPLTACTILESSCEDFELCQPSRDKKRMCTKERCTREGQVLGERDMCFTKGQMYDLQTRRCAQRPSSFSLCRLPFTPMPINFPVNTPTTICTVMLSTCKANVCDSNQRRQTVCERESCSREGQYLGERSICFIPGLYYDLTSRRCVQQPASKDLCDPVPPPSPSICTIVESSCQDYNVCFPSRATQRLCERERCARNGLIIGEQKLCDLSGQLYDASQRTCVPVPTGNELCNEPQTPSTTCTTVNSTCQSFEVCDPTRRTQRLCLKEECTREGQYVGETNMCFTQGELFDLEKRQCVRPPTGGALCENQRPICNILDSSCEDFDVCIPLKREQRLCEREKCTIGGVDQGEQNKCSGALLYDIKNRNCVARPSKSNLCPDQGNLAVSEQGTITCSSDQLIPKNEWIISLYCKKYPMCNADNQFTGMKEFCGTYYECYQKDGKWEVAKRKCSTGLLYSYEVGGCTPKPTSAELCAGITINNRGAIVPDFRNLV